MRRQVVSWDLGRGNSSNTDHSELMDTMKSRYPCIHQPLNPLAATPEVEAEEADADRRYLTPLWLFGSRDIEGPESPLPLSFSHMMVEQNIVDPHTIKERIISALKALRFRDQGVLVQFWSPVVVKKRWLLTTWDQPFGISVANEGLYSYRLKSEQRAIVVDGEDREELSPAGRVYSQRLPEWSLGVHGGYNMYGYIDFPIFESSSDSCVGVLEIITSSNYVDYAFEVQEVSRALKKQNLNSPNVFDVPAITVADDRKRHTLDEIFKALKTVCDTHNLPLAQTWALSEYSSYLADSGNIVQTCSSFNKGCIGKVCMSTYDLPYYVADLSMWDFHKACTETHLDKSQGVVGRSFSSCATWFCRDVTELEEDDYPLVPYARMSGITSCLAIYIKSLELDVEYVIEFFLPTRSTDEVDLRRLMKNVKHQIKNASCVQLDIMSAPQVIGGLPFSWNLESSPSHTTLLTEKEEDIGNEPSSSVAVGTSQSVAPYLEKGITDFVINPGKTRRKRKRSESSIRLEEIEKHFGKTMDEAAAILTVSRSTLKRVCRNLGIPRWPYRSGPDKTDSLMKSDLTDVVIHTSERALTPILEVSSEPLGTTNVTHDSTTVTTHGKHSPTHTNLPDETIGANTVENVMIKATYGNNTVKFQFGLSDGLLKLEELVATRFQLKVGNIRLKYIDEDNDMILIASDSDLKVSLSTFQTPDFNAVIKLFVEPVAQQSSNP